jgi:hypothetical protein
MFLVLTFDLRLCVCVCVYFPTNERLFWAYEAVHKHGAANENGKGIYWYR